MTALRLPPLTLPSPLHRLDRLSDRWGLDLWIKRDDLIAQCLGGNKVRKVHRILAAAQARGELPALLVTNGGANSNHARVVALMGAQLGCRVHLVLHGTPTEPAEGLGNATFYRAASAQTTYVDAEDIAATLDAVAMDARARGERVLVIPGGAHTPEAVEAYADAVAELPFLPDVIVHASGTGGTQAGLMAGVARAGAATRVIGISVARTAERGAAEVARLLPPEVPASAVVFDDAFRFGGYERHTPELLAFVEGVIRLEGMPFDPTYTGKALFGLERMAAEGKITMGAQVLFWHTGGLLNLRPLSTSH